MAPPNITVQAPASLFGAQYTSPDGTQYQVTSAGLLTIPVTWLSVVLNAGFTIPSGDALPNDGVTAFATGGQTSATLLKNGINRVSTVATAADSVKLPVSVGGEWVIVTNDTANPMQVFGSGTDTINGVATATGVSQAPKSSVVYSCPLAGVWQATSLGIGYSGSLPTFSSATGITAFPTGGQASAVLLAATTNRVTTCATDGDSVKLPASAVGLEITVKNAGAKLLDIFPSTGDAINALAANVALRIMAGSAITFICSVAGTWDAQVPSLPSAKYVKNQTSGATTAAQYDLTGAAYVQAEFSAVGANNLTTRTATQMFADMGNVQPGDSYVLEITNTSGGTTTILAGGGVTLTGTMTLATNTTRRFNVKFTSATALVIQSTGVGTIS